MARTILRNARIVYPDGLIVDGGLVCEDGKVAQVFRGEGPSGDGIDAGGHHVIPGVIDPHVQLSPQPDWDHYATETRSAAIGGVTTIIKMRRAARLPALRADEERLLALGDETVARHTG